MRVCVVVSLVVLQSAGKLLFRWISLAEALWAQGIAKLVNPDTQDRPTQDEIVCTAMGHLAASSRWAAEGKDPLLCLTVARCVSAVVTPRPC